MNLSRTTTRSLASAVALGLFTPVSFSVLRAEDQAEINRRLLQRLEQLETEVKELRKSAPKGQSLPQVQVEPGYNTVKLEELEQKIRVLDRKNELAAEAAAEKAKTTPVVSAGPGGFQFRSADTNFVIRLRGYVQADARFFPNDHAAGAVNDTFLMRRVRPILEGTVYEKYDFRLMLDFASGITSSAANNGFVQDAYLNARLFPQFQIQAGKFKEPVGLERLQSGANLLFIERGFPTLLVPNRDVGVQFHGSFGEGLLTYQAGVFNGVTDGASGDQEAADDDKDIAARIFGHPFKNSSIEGLRGLGVGIAGTVGNQEGALRPLTTPGQQRFFAYRSGRNDDLSTIYGLPLVNVSADGEHWRLVPQAYYYWGPFGLYGEYVFSQQSNRRDLIDNNGFITSSSLATFRNTAWQVAGSYVLSGEDNSFNALQPRRPFSLSEPGWGAFELTARAGGLDVDKNAFGLGYAHPSVAAVGAFSWGVGLNWHLNRNVKLSLDYEQTRFDRSTASPGAGIVPPTSPLLLQGEKAVLTRAQVSF
jgi:phosphate-selective porin OprO/OprP